MAKSKKKKKPVQHATKEPREISAFIRHTINFLAAAALALFVYWALFFIPGYDFLPKRIIKSNLDYIAKNDTLSLAKRTAGKLGWSAYFFDNIKRNLPDDAVVLLPPQEVISVFNKDKKKKKEQINYYKNPAWVSYFLYPVRYVYADDEASPLLTEVTHVAVFNRWGFNRLTYKPKEYLGFDILPIKPL